ncbi:hypothetical protein D3C71_1731980 [compost metagenome]
MTQIAMTEFAPQRRQQIAQQGFWAERPKFAFQTAAEQIDQQITQPVDPKQPHAGEVPLERPTQPTA